MSYLINNQQKLNDIVFAGRNKSYGAYAIRSSYGTTLLKSILLMFSGITACILTAYFLSNHADSIDPSGQVLPNEVIKTTIFDMEPKEKTTAKSTVQKAPLPAKQPEAKGGLVSVVDSANIKTPEKLNQDIPQTVVTNTGTSMVMPGDDDEHKQGKTDGDDKTKKGDEVRHLYGVDSQPEFEGGLGALGRFLSKNMRYPTIAVEGEREGIVHVEFVVDENGKVGSLRLQNKAGYGFDEEALRVVGLIPNFKTPAKVDGKPVKVYYQLPIRFKLR